MRIAFLALTNPDSRPIQDVVSASRLANTLHPCENTKLRIYDAVGPETMSILTMLEVFAKYQGNFNFRPVHIGYKNMERILNVRSLGNLNRQFVSLLRSEQDSLAHPIIGYPDVWDSILPGDTGRMCTLDEAFSVNQELVKASSRMRFFGPRKRFPYWKVVNHIIHNPRVIPPGIDLSLEIIHSYLTNRKDGFA